MKLLVGFYHETQHPLQSKCANPLTKSKNALKYSSPCPMFFRWHHSDAWSISPRGNSGGKKSRHQMQSSFDLQIPVCPCLIRALHVLCSGHTCCNNDPGTCLVLFIALCFSHPDMKTSSSLPSFKAKLKVFYKTLPKQPILMVHVYNQFVLWAPITCDLYLFYTAL